MTWGVVTLQSTRYLSALNAFIWDCCYSPLFPSILHSLSSLHSSS